MGLKSTEQWETTSPRTMHVRRIQSGDYLGWDFWFTNDANLKVQYMTRSSETDSGKVHTYLTVGDHLEGLVY